MVQSGHHRKGVIRYNIPGSFHELTFSCCRNLNLLKSERACSNLARAIIRACEKLDYGVLAYVSMPDHVHLPVKPLKEEYSISVLSEINFTEEAETLFEKKCFHTFPKTSRAQTHASGAVSLKSIPFVNRSTSFSLEPIPFFILYKLFLDSLFYSSYIPYWSLGYISSRLVLDNNADR